MTTEEKQNYVRIGLSIINIEIHPEILSKVIEVIKIVDKKKGSSNVEDFIKMNQKINRESAVNKSNVRNTQSR